VDVGVLGRPSEFLFRASALLAIAPDDDHARARMRKATRHLLSNSIGAAGDKRGLVVVMRAHVSSAGPLERADAKKLIRFPSGSRNSIERLPQGCVVGSRTNSLTMLPRRARSASTSSTSKSRITERLVP